MGDFSHLSARGEAAQVDITGKNAAIRRATVDGLVTISAACAAKLTPDAAREIVTTARLAGIQAAKRTSELIPLCHQVTLNGVDMDIAHDANERRFTIRATARATAATGVEMEAFCAAQIAALTIYDMIKAVDPAAVIGPFRLLEKHGGKHGPWTRTP